MPIYEEYAAYYDGSGQIRFAILMAQYLNEVLERHAAPGRRALDVACGTGTLAIMLADRGWDVVGLDASESMLALARAKAANLVTGGKLSFVQGDMRELLAGDERRTHEEQSAAAARLSADEHPSAALRPSSFDLVTCIYDSLNYLLTEDELAACFGGVAKLLAPGGLFFCDMNTRHFLEHDWGTAEVLERPGFVQVSQSHFDAAAGRSTMVLTGFVGSDEQGYTRFDEVHVEQAYDPPVVIRLLEQAGLTVESAYDCFTFLEPGEQSQRIAWVARREQDSGRGR